MPRDNAIVTLYLYRVVNVNSNGGPDVLFYGCPIVYIGVVGFVGIGDELLEQMHRTGSKRCTITYTPPVDREIIARIRSNRIEALMLFMLAAFGFRVA